MSDIYNPLKLSVYRPLFLSKKVLVIGGGAVGSHVAEAVAKMGANVDIVDFDSFTLENAAKHSCLVRTPEDVGRNKAECVSARVQPLLEDGASSNGIDTNLCMLGPEAIAEYHVVVLCVDNFAAKDLFNQLWMQIPKERRPIVIMDGTYNETCESVAADGEEFCLRCLMDESWLEKSTVKTSCAGPMVRQIDGVEEIIRTSQQASAIAAAISSEQFRGVVIGVPNVINHRISYSPYPNLSLSEGHPKRKKNCPGCKFHPPAQIHWMQGNVLELTLGEAIQQVGNVLGSNKFELITHCLYYGNKVLSGFVIDDVCHSCGKPISVMRHEGRLFLDDLRCEDCRSAGKTAFYSTAYQPGTKLQAFASGCDESLKKKTLFELGYPLGAHIQVLERHGAKDVLDDKKFVVTTFACEDDHLKMHTVKKL